MNSREVKIMYYPTEKMVADFSTKPLQGKVFVAHQNIIMRICEDDYRIHKQQYKEALKRYDLWDKFEKDLFDL